ncbi:cAMP-regulated phosphoprotein 21 isoform X3 [Euwallacea fornicatus]|uniref:cAMP-regulated phosphoprotein 21 isoform X3 n=1 Tax=Euwallacea fornicatus TaxID=995702 RepID=UPI00338E4E9B
MQQRGANMEAGGEEVEEQPPPSRGRPTSKLKVLGRSHAMREEQSPPREPNCADNHTSGGQLHSPPTVVLSPSPLDEDSSAISGAGSPATLVASPNSRCSSLCDSNGGCERLHPAEADLPPSPKYVNGKNGTASNSSQVGSKSSKRYCECQNQNCIKCLKDRGGTNNNHSNTNNNTSLLYVNKNRGKMRQQSSSQTNLSFESSAGTSSCLSRDSSAEYYTDTTGVDLEQFIPDTINRNPKDRALMLRIEEELVSLINDKFQTHYKFPPMTSYHRMLVHRCAAYFGMDHNIDQSGKCIVVNKTKNTRLPDVRFKEHVKEVFNDEPPRRSILKRDSNSIEDYCFKSPERGYGLEGRRSKSFEEREEEYERARRRIFRGDMHDSSEDFGWDMQWSSTESDYSRYRLQPPEFQSRQLRRLLKVHSEEAEQSMRPCVAKSYSFGGYGGASVSLLTRGDSVISTHSAPMPRLLTKQDSGASSVSWRLSPSSSGYKSQSQMSESVTPSPTSTPHPSGDEHHHKSANPVVWAVTDLSNVPRGSIIINPETGKPFKNEDGTIYYYDPVKPAPGLVPDEPLKTERAQSPQKDKTPPMSPKSEKKHSPLKTKSSFTNSATSPSLPFSPPLSTASSGVAMNRSFSYIQTVNSCENVVSALGPAQQQQQYSNFSNQPADGNMPVYSQPYIVYTTAPGYGVPVQQPYDTRLDQQNIQEMSTTFFVPEAASAPGAAQTITYQSPSSGAFWNQPATVGFYASGTQPPVQSGAPPRYSVQVPAQPQPTYVSTGYPPAVNYVAAQPGPAQVQNAEIVPVYPNQSVQMVYSQPTGTVMYQNQPLIYAQNPTTLYQTTAYQPAPAYPHGTPTPTGGMASLPTTPLEQATPNGFVQLTQNMQQMNLGPSQSSTPRGFVPIHPKCGHPFDPRRPSFSKPPSGGYTGKSGRFPMGSSQSSTGTSSPAATVVAPGYCPTLPPPGHYRTPPPSTPPTPQFAVFSQGGYPAMGPRLFRQMSAERGATPGTAKSSRSPTPAGDVGNHFERQRFTFPPSFYPGMPMPYIIQSDPRLVGRGQPNIYRQPTPPAMHNRPAPTQGPDMRSHYNNYKNRKPKVFLQA